MSRRLDSGALTKAKLESSGLMSLLYEQKVVGVGRLGLSAHLDTTKPTTAAPLIGFSWTL
jgi:hypothetical protein